VVLGFSVVEWISVAGCDRFSGILCFFERLRAGFVVFCYFLGCFREPAGVWGWYNTVFVCF